MNLIPVQNIDHTDPIWLLAKEQSHKSDHKFKIGAVIAKRGRVIGFGLNSCKSHPRFGSKAPYRTLHAEGSAIWDSLKRSNDPLGATMYVYRKDGRTSKPCVDCQRLLEIAGISKVYYSETKE